MTLNGTKYTYENNARGDVTGLLDSSGNEVVTYQYDSWGKLLNIGGSLKDTVGVKNPFRYRSYYYDTETGLYYLQSRYYNPEIGRFISKDDTSYHQGEDKAAANLYAYCDNNPIVFSDPDGHRVSSITYRTISGILQLAARLGWKAFGMVKSAIKLGCTAVTVVGGVYHLAKMLWNWYGSMNLTIALISAINRFKAYHKYTINERKVWIITLYVWIT